MEEITEQLRLERFVDQYLKTGDEADAAAEYANSKDRKYLLKIGKRLLSDPVVIDMIDQAKNKKMNRKDLEKELTEIISDESGKHSKEDKWKARTLLEKVTRLSKGDAEDELGKKLEGLFVEYGDVLDDFMNGDPDEFEKIFRPQLKNGKVVFDVKKNDSPEVRRKAFAVLLRALISRRAFS